jgi:hypothetical protein
MAPYLYQCEDIGSILLHLRKKCNAGLSVPLRRTKDPGLRVAFRCPGANMLDLAYVPLCTIIYMSLAHLQYVFPCSFTYAKLTVHLHREMPCSLPCDNLLR